jgi:sirohydrochlorin ferrochelatase
LETLAEQLGMANAYWANAPSLADQVQKLVTNGVEHIGVLLYFLFPGGITDAIATEILSLRQQYPQVQFHLAPPLSDRPGFQDLLRDICVDQLQNSKNCKNSL